MIDLSLMIDLYLNLYYSLLHQNFQVFLEPDKLFQIHLRRDIVLDQSKNFRLEGDLASQDRTQL